MSRVEWYARRKWRFLVRMVRFINTLVTISLNYSQYSDIAVFTHFQFTVAHGLGFFVSTSRLLETDLNTGSITVSLNYIHMKSSLHLLRLHRSTENWQLTTDWQLLVSESESELLYDWRFTANQFVLAPSPVKLTARIFSFQLNTCGYSSYVTSPLTRGCVCTAGVKVKVKVTLRLTV
jgi:hypothetical protein